ncbi:unnamed protein product [Symbiodinium sp. CCMP2592]|nr:unnamed protein product [Symbiodinium sp. CCMP2592]
MIQQTAALQIRIDRAKATYQELLEKMKVCQSDLQSKQAEVTAMQSELEATLRADASGLEDPARKDDPLEGLLDTLAKVGIVLTQEQKELYEEAQRGKLNDGQQNMEVEATNQPGLTAPTRPGAEAVARSKVREWGQYTNQGCGYVAVTLRTQGADLTVVSLYLQSSSGFGSPVNSDILASLRAIRQSVRGPILIGGDWNSPLKDLLDTSIFQSLSLEPIGPNKATCGDNELDFLAVSHCLEGLLRVDASWDVPFKPHAAIQVALNVGAFQLTTPQLPSFVLSFREEPLDYIQVEETLASLPDTTLSADPLSNRLASISSSVEHSLLQSSQGIGRQLQVEFLPAVPRMSQFAWEGSCQAFWHRVQFLCQGDHPKRREQCQEYLPQILDHWQGNSEEAVSFLSTLQACLSEQAAVPEPVQQLLQEQFLLASKVHQEAQTKSYRFAPWLEPNYGSALGKVYLELRTFLLFHT